MPCWTSTEDLQSCVPYLPRSSGWFESKVHQTNDDPWYISTILVLVGFIKVNIYNLTQYVTARKISVLINFPQGVKGKVVMKII